MEKEAAYTLFTLGGAEHRKVEPILVILQVNNIALYIEVDSAAISIISVAAYCWLWP